MQKSQVFGKASNVSGILEIIFIVSFLNVNFYYAQSVRGRQINLRIGIGLDNEHVFVILN